MSMIADEGTTVGRAAEARVTDEPTPATVRRRWQVGLRGMALLVLVAALAVSIELNRRRLAELAPRIAQLRPIARKLEVIDPRQFAAVSVMADSHHDEAWDVHVPADRAFRLCVATSGIGEVGVAPPVRSAPLVPGRHRLTLMSRDRMEGTRFVVLDGVDPILSVEESTRYLTRSVPMLGFARQFPWHDIAQSPADRPLVLHRRRHVAPTAAIPRPTQVPAGPVDGLLLWVELAESPPTEPGVR